jgi:hypothetical protein
VRFALGCAFTLSGLVADDAIAQTSGRSVSATRPRYATDTSMRSPNSLPRLVRQPSQIPPVGKQVSSSSSYQPADSLNQPAGQPAGQPAAQPPSPPTKELPAEKLPAEKLPAEKLPAEKLPAESVPSTPLAPPRPPRDTGDADEAVPPPRPQRGDVRLDGALLLSEAEQIAVAQHPALVEAQARIQAAQGQWLQAGLYPNPIVGYSGQQLGSRGQAEQQGVVVQGDLVLGGKLRLNRAVAEQQIVQAEMEFAGRQLRVLTNVRKSFYEVLVAQRRVDLNDQLVSVGAKGLQAA